MAKNAVTDWSTSAASNTDVGGIGIQGSSNISSGDNSFREIMAQIATQFGKLNAKGADLASGSTVDLSTATGAFVHITGTTTITALGTVTAGRVFRLEFDGALTLTHNGTSLILPGAANITTAAGDTAEFISEGAGNWRCINYQRNSGVVIALGTTAIAAHDNLSTKGADVASAATTDIGAATGSYIHITGTTGITALGTKTAGVVRKVVFDAALTLTHDGTSLILPGGANITTAVGDAAEFVSEGSGNWRCVSYLRATGRPLVAIVMGTPIASTSGTSIDITGIPAGTRVVTVNFSGVSTNGTSNPIIQLGDSGGIEATGYAGGASVIDTAVSTSLHTTGFGIAVGNAAMLIHGSITIMLENATTNTWVASGVFSRSDAAQTSITAGSKSLSPGPLDRVRITTVGGVNTFDAGEINITYQ